jgi:glycosyltransferase involved in cell wall biosynthesis
LSWLKALAHARDSGVKFKATWYGEGPIKADFLQEIERLKLNNQVIAPGYVNDRHILLENIRKSDIFLMTHVTDESPRCIIESLFCATPVFGYSSSYAIDVLGIKPAGILVPAGDWKALGESIVNINKERHLLAELIGLAGIRGEKFTDEQVFEERAKIIKRSH